MDESWSNMLVRAVFRGSWSCTERVSLGGVEVKYVQWKSWRFRGDVMRGCGLFLAVVAILCVGGCHDRVQLPSPERVAEFENAGPSSLAVDTDRLVRARMQTGPYRANFGDVLGLELPIALYPDVPAAGQTAGGRVTHTSRTSDEGMITLPDGRQIHVVEKTVGEIESLIVDAYYPALVKTRPSVYVRVLEYRTYRLQIVGAVTTPGVHQLRHDQMSLVSLLMEAGGITDTGAARIRIERAEKMQAKSVRQAVARFSSMSEPADPAANSSSNSNVIRRSVLMGTQGGTGLQFDPEGPLVTTGWLRVSKDDTPIVDVWLDIMNDPQRSAALESTADHVTPEIISELHGRLRHLGQFLESRAGGAGQFATDTALPSGWYRISGGRYAALAVSQETRARSSDHWGQGTLVGFAGQDGTLTSEALAREEADATLIMPVRGLNIPFADVALREGDTVYVERIKAQWISVLGLVNSPGNFPYPPDSEYRLADALALAGGLDQVAEPRYVCVYRLRADGEVVGATFQLVDTKNQETLTRQLALKVKPGDVVSVERTPRTRSNVFLDRVIRITLGLYLDPRDLWESDGD
jgi:protein involved in polysaccharide export with SLBB domain